MTAREVASSRETDRPRPEHGADRPRPEHGADRPRPEHGATVTDVDRAHLARAVVVARRARGRTSPNPAVGCVIVRDGEVVADGATEPAGGPHAEIVALRGAGDAARGSTAFVSLEPCAHHGRTPPCTDALARAGVSRVVVAHPDPNAVAASGAARLRDAGIRVDEVVGPLRAAVAGDLEGFLTSVKRGRPHVTLKLAQTLDGALTSATGRWLTGRAARQAVHRWRATVDAVLVGSGTVVADDPALDIREVPLGDRPQPRPVVLDARLRTPPAARVVARGALVVTTPDAPNDRRRALEAAGAEVVDVDAAAEGHGVDLTTATRALRAHDITSILAEPGHTLAQALLDADTVDRLVLHIAAGEGPLTPSVTVAEDRWTTTRWGGAGPDLIWERVPSSPREGAQRGAAERLSTGAVPSSPREGAQRDASERLSASADPPGIEHGRGGGGVPRSTRDPVNGGAS